MIDGFTEFASKYHLLIIGLINAVLWYIYIFPLKKRSVLNFALFPFFNAGRIINVRDNISTFPITYSYILIIYGIVFQLFTNDYVYCIGFGLLLIIESYVVISYVFQARKKGVNLSFLSFITVLVGLAIAVTLKTGDYQILNRFDFCENLIIFSGSSYIVFKIIIKDKFTEEMEAFFIFFGIIIYSFLHILATILLIFNIAEFFIYASNATLLTFIYWMIIIPWIHRLRSEIT